MLRRDPTPKWKQVLGFDDGVPRERMMMPPPSPPYSDDDLESEISLPLPPPQFRYPAEFPQLPKDMTFTRTGRQDLHISPSSPAPSPNDIKPLPDPPPLFYMTCQQDPASESGYVLPKPDLIFHAGPAKSCSIMSFASFTTHPVSLVTDITLCPLAVLPSPSISNRASMPNFYFPTPIASHRYGSSFNLTPRLKTEKLTPSGGIFSAEKYAFHLILPRTGVRERFEWRHSSGPFVRTMDGMRESGGLKLVRSITGEMVAVYAGLGHSSRTRNPRRVVGMFRFLGDRLGEEFDVFAIMSILSIVERGRRAMEANKIAFGIT